MRNIKDLKYLYRSIHDWICKMMCRLWQRDELSIRISTKILLRKLNFNLTSPIKIQTIAEKHFPRFNVINISVVFGLQITKPSFFWNFLVNKKQKCLTSIITTQKCRIFQKINLATQMYPGWPSTFISTKMSHHLSTEYFSELSNSALVIYPYLVQCIQQIS